MSTCRFSILLSMKLLSLVGLVGVGRALDNGLAATPPMGFSAKYEPSDCAAPGACFDEDSYDKIGRMLVDKEFKKAGYLYVSIAANWAMKDRQLDGNSGPRLLVADPARFRRGMKHVIDGIHGRGLRASVFLDVGEIPCDGTQRSLKKTPAALISGVNGYADSFHVADIDMYLTWGVDAFIFGGCGAPTRDDPFLYPKLNQMIAERIRARRGPQAVRGLALDAAIPAVLISCEWPAYLAPTPEQTAQLALLCNTWSLHRDPISDSWASVVETVKFFGKENPDHALVNSGGANHWNDPSVLLIGQRGLSLSQQQTQMGVWAILAAPLYFSADLATMDAATAAILKNPKVISVNQDVSGKQGWVVHATEEFRGWKKPMALLPDGKQRVAVLIENLKEDFVVSAYSFDPARWGIVGAFDMEEVYNSHSKRGLSGVQSVPIADNSSVMFVVTFALPR